MDTFFTPRSVAVVGVSESPTNLGRRIIQNLINFQYDGIIYAVGPRGGVSFGRRIYHSVLDIPDSIDLAVILTPARTIPEILADCGQKGIRRAVIESAGFSEFGEEGKALEADVLEVARRASIRLMGPNGIGSMNMANGLCLPFAAINENLTSGHISIITQSGGVGLSYLNLLASESLGLAKYASIGNKLDVDENDLLEYLIEDEETSIICMYLEGISDGRRLMETARRSTKPILLHKSNIGLLGNRIAQSHTAALSSDDKVVDAALRQCGVVRFNDMHQLGNFLKVLSLPRLRGRNLAVLSRSGGHAVIAADWCEEAGFNLPPFPEPFLEEIAKHFRAKVIRLQNPLDLGDLFEPEVYLRIVEETLKEDGIDGIVFLHTYHPKTEVVRSRDLLPAIERLSSQYDKPVAICISTEESEISHLRKHYTYPIFTNPEDPIRALSLSYCYDYSEPKKAPAPPSFDWDPGPIREVVHKALAEGRDLFLDEALGVLAACGIPVVPGTLAHSLDEAVAAADEASYPVAIKVVSAEISHKSDVGGVRIDVRSREELEAAYGEMMARVEEGSPGAAVRGIMVQSMARRGRDLILGARQNREFGPIVLVGIGGIFVEIFRDVSIRVDPIDRDDALQMLEELKGSSILHPVRGIKGSDLDSAADALLRLAHLVREFPEIREIDINPMRLFFEGEGGIALDARIVL